MKAAVGQHIQILRDFPEDEVFGGMVGKVMFYDGSKAVVEFDDGSGMPALVKVVEGEYEIVEAA